MPIHERATAWGVGAFNLIRRSAYEQIGGWERLRMEVIEDLRMGYLIKRAGFASRVVTGRNLIRIRWAEGAWGVVTNLTKNVFAAFRFRPSLMMAGIAGVALLCLPPFGALAIGIAGGGPAWVWPGAIAFAALVALHWSYRHNADPGNASVLLWACCFPAGALLFLFAMIRSTLLTLARRGVVWRGTFYPLKELREHAGPLQ